MPAVPLSPPPRLPPPDEEAAFAPLRACRQLEQLELPDGSLSAVPDALTALTRLTSLSFRGGRWGRQAAEACWAGREAGRCMAHAPLQVVRGLALGRARCARLNSPALPPPACLVCPAGCDRLEAFGSLCAHKSDPFAALAALPALRCLDFSRCALEELPPHLAGLPQLRTLLLAANQLTTLPPPADPAAVAVAAAAAARAGAAARGGAAAGRAAAPPPLVALPPHLEHLDLRGNALRALPAALFAPAVAAHLTHLDLSGCWDLNLAAADWRRLVAALPRLRLLRHRWAAVQGGVEGGACALRRCLLPLHSLPATWSIHCTRARAAATCWPLRSEATAAARAWLPRWAAARSWRLSSGRPPPRASKRSCIRGCLLLLAGTTAGALPGTAPPAPRPAPAAAAAAAAGAACAAAAAWRLSRRWRRRRCSRAAAAMMMRWLVRLPTSPLLQVWLRGLSGVQLL